MAQFLSHFSKIVLTAMVVFSSHSAFANQKVKDVAAEYSNLISWQHVVQDGNTDIIRLADVKSLPSGVLDTLELLGLFVNFELPKQWDATSSYGILEPEDIMAIFDDSGVVGYAVNIAECTTEECSGWDALYLDEKGFIVEQSFTTK